MTRLNFETKNIICEIVRIEISKFTLKKRIPVADGDQKSQFSHYIKHNISLANKT